VGLGPSVPSAARDAFAHEALAQIPKILTLCDRNPHSPTYGSFDRSFWQYKVVDFPSGMSQEFVLPLALAYGLPIPGNRYHQQPNLKTWAIAGMRYAASSSHPDGSCDDYFPFERAGGAAAFSLLACLDAYQLLECKDPELLDFFQRRADWLAHHQESGRLANHQALIVLCLDLIGELVGSDRWDSAQRDRLNQVLSWQSSEGWFQEYEGCDPGYQTLTISCLARLYDRWEARGDTHPTLKAAILKAVNLAAEFVHPDGSFGGEYTSRNTYNFFPHGFELVGRWHPAALSVNDRILAAIARGDAPCYADDRIIGHHTWNYLLAWRDFVGDRPPTQVPPIGRVWLADARIAIDRRLDRQGRRVELFLALNKGGAFKLFRGDRMVASDTQFSIQVRQGRQLKNAVGHLVGKYDLKLDTDEIWVRGKLGWAKQTQMTPLKLMILRAVMLTVGRFFPNLIRRLLQQILIVGKQETPYRFLRHLRWDGDHWRVTDELRSPDWSKLESVGIGVDQTSIYVVMSRTYQSGQLQPWLELSDRIHDLHAGEPLEIERVL
jgi:hypothetical protein